MASTQFSSYLQLTDLNDFIQPSQECIKPIQIAKKSAINSKESIKFSQEGNYFQVQKDGSDVKLNTVKISLGDCLACSGCVTSAETHLITQQSIEEFKNVLQQNNEILDPSERKIIVVSISPQSISSLSVFLKLTYAETCQKLRNHLKYVGCNYVFDTVYARNFSLLETANEFVDRWRDNKFLPLFTSACPGWICYAEKRHAFILPYISIAKSPQQVSGSLIKYVYDLHGSKRHKIYHVSIMPCFDKKLEASRSDFASVDENNEDVKDVDCVLSTNELLEFINNLNFQDGDDNLLPILSYPENEEEESFSISHSGGGSGGYAEFTLNVALKELVPRHEVASYAIIHKEIITDITELWLVNTLTQQVLLKFAKVYGFKNIQKIVQKVKRNKSPYSFIEIMACPKGCLNGGGQIKAGKTKEELELTYKKVENIYENLRSISFESVKEKVHKVKDTNKHLTDLLKTHYNPVLKEATDFNIKW